MLLFNLLSDRERVASECFVHQIKFKKHTLNTTKIKKSFFCCCCLTLSSTTHHITFANEFYTLFHAYHGTMTDDISIPMVRFWLYFFLLFPFCRGWDNILMLLVPKYKNSCDWWRLQHLREFIWKIFWNYKISIENI